MNYNITSQEIEDGKLMGGIAYLGLIGFIIAFATSQNNRYVIYHAQQSLGLIIASFILSMTGIIAAIPIIGWLAGIASFVFGIGAIVLLIMGVINGFSGKVEPLPIIGEHAFKLNLLKHVSDFHDQQNTDQAYNENKYAKGPEMIEPPRQNQQERDPYSYGDDEFRKDKY